jgi:hypothetical protein
MANKGVMLDAASRSANSESKRDVFSVTCGELERVAGNGLSEEKSTTEG